MKYTINCGLASFDAYQPAQMGGKEMTPETRRAVWKWLIQSALGLVGYGVVIFLPAGRLDWVWGWAMLGSVAVGLVGQVAVLVPINPSLLVERGRGLRTEGAKRWDMWVAGLATVAWMIGWIVAGLDFRLGWSGPMPLAVHLVGVAVTAFGWVMFLWAMASNAFFAEAVRIQDDRGHTVITDGPYRVVRHPGYVGSISMAIATPLLLGSVLAIIPTAFAVGLFVLRTALEDKTLQEELDGYKDYAQKTRYRLLPGIW
jgi:protein-S-isoprenylcysteine O-methyltransferase Ste14